MLVPPQKHKPFKLYLSADERAIGSALIQEFEGKERVIYFISRRLLDAETSKDDVIKYMLSLPILSGRIGKWILALSEFDLRYQSAKAVKGQVMADFVVQHCGPKLGVVDLVP